VTQFAYVQLQTIIATVVRNLTLNFEGDFPSPNYQASPGDLIFHQIIPLTVVSPSHQTMVVLPKGGEILFKSRQ
jgi:hypothetical protein